MTPKETLLEEYRKKGVAVSDERIQQADDPIAELKSLPDRAVVVVPAEYLWDAKLKPGTNPLHKRQYDADLLTEHLEAAGYANHIIRVLEFGGWSFLYAESLRVRDRSEASEGGAGAPGFPGGTGQARDSAEPDGHTTRQDGKGVVSGV